MTRPLEGRVAAVTGASRGIGRAVALALAAAGAHVVAMGRTVGALEELDDAIRADGGSATLVPFDLKDEPAFERLGAAIEARWGRLDVLVANAGMLGPLSPLGHVTAKVFDEVMAVNVAANHRLIRVLDPLLRQSAAGRVVFISSGAAHAFRAYWGPYAVSKAALEALAFTYAAECTAERIRVTVVNPGPLRTAMRQQAMPGEDPNTLRTPEELAPRIVALCRPESDAHGVIYDFPTDRLLRPQRPQPV